MRRILGNSLICRNLLLHYYLGRSKFLYLLWHMKNIRKYIYCLDFYLSHFVSVRVVFSFLGLQL